MQAVSGDNGCLASKMSLTSIVLHGPVHYVLEAGALVLAPVHRTVSVMGWRWCGPSSPCLGLVEASPEGGREAAAEGRARGAGEGVGGRVGGTLARHGHGGTCW